MRILMVHNYYQQWGGEDTCAEQETQLLASHGHQVYFYTRHNDEIREFSPWQRGRLLWETTWSRRTYRELQRILRTFKPDITHVHNFLPLISPSAFYACADAGVPAVLTLHSYRLLCANGWFFRDGGICEECLEHSLWRGIMHGCYRGSPAQTLPVTLMLKTHRVMNTWIRKVSVFIALTEFVRRKFVQGGIPASKITVRPNFLAEDPGPGGPDRDYALFVGRLSPEKGLKTLLDAWRALPDIPLKIVGGGPLHTWIEDTIRRINLPRIDLVGFVPPESVPAYMKRAFCLLMPSMLYETFGRTIIEAYATGTPVIASRLGAMAELVEHQKTGLLFEAGNADDLATQVQYAISHPEQRAEWGQAARRVFEQRYSADVAYTQLMDIYAHVLQRASAV